MMAHQFKITLKFWLLLTICKLAESTDPPNIWSLDQNSFQLFSAVKLNTIKIGDILEFRLTLTPQESFAEPDTLIFEISASYNGYSCLIFCGDPEITFKNTVFPFSRYGVTYDQVFEGISYDSYVYDFGQLQPDVDDDIYVDFKMLVADNPMYAPGEQYWMGVGVEYNQSRSIWVNDIAFTLDDRPLQYEGEQARFDTSSEIYTYSPGASQSNYLILIDPHISMGFRLVVNLTDDVNDDMCICDVRPFDMAVSFIGCQNPSFPPYVVRSLPPFNDTKCKKEFQLDYGLLTKLNIPFADAYDTVVMEIIMCAKDTAESEYNMDVYLDTSASPEIPKVYQSLKFIRSPREELTSFPCSVDVKYTNFKKGSEISIAATVDPAPYDTSTVYKVQHNMEIKGCNKKDPILNLRPRLVMKSRYVEFMEEISFKNISGLLVAEYDSIRVTRKHHTLYTEQEYFRFVVDFSGTFNVDPAECPDLVISSDVVLITESGQAFSQCPLVDYAINSTNAINEKCGYAELKLLNIADLENPSWAMHAGSESFLSFSYTMTNETCRATVLKDVRLTVAIPQDPPNYPSLLTLKRFRLTHAGDNFPGLQRQIISDVFEKPNRHTTPYFDIGSVWSSLEFGDVDYVAVNSEDMYDRQIVLTAEFYLYDDGSINASWTNDISFFSGNYDEGGWVESVQLLIYYDVNTTELILPDYGGDFRMLDNPNDELLQLEVQYPYPFVGEEFAWNLEKQVKAWSVSLYISSHQDFNEMALAVFVTGMEAFANYESVEIIPGRNIYLHPMNSSFSFTITEADLLGETPRGVWSLANLESFKNETKKDDMLQVYIQMRAVAARAGSTTKQRVWFCYISYYTHKTEKCLKDEQEIPGTDAIVDGDINSIPSTMEFQEGSVGIPQKGAGPVEFTLYLAPRSVIDLRLEVTASLSELNPNPAPCTPIVQSVELISIGHYIGYPDYENFGMEECESFSYVEGTAVCNKVVANFGHVSNLNFNRDSPVEIEQHKMNFVAIIGVDEECVSGDIDLTVEFKNMNALNKTFIKATNTFIGVAPLPDPVPGKSIYSVVHFYKEGRITRERLTTMSGEAERYLVEVFLDDDVTDEIRINVGSAVSSFVSNNADGGADFVVHGIHVWDLGSDIYGAFDLNNTLELNFLALMENGEGPILGFQENMAEINLGIFSHIPNSARALKSVNSRPDTETKPNSILIAVDIELQDEPRIVKDNGNLTFTVTAEAVRHSVVHSYSFMLVPEFQRSRLPLLQMILTSYFLVPREAIPGDQGTYGVQLFHLCESRSEARDLRVVIHMPDYANYVEADWINNNGRAAVNTISRDDSVEFEFISLHRTEYLSFNVTFVFTEGHSYFKVARIYFTSLPMEYFYSQFGRDSDDARDVSLYSPKIRTELIQLYVPESSCSNLIDIHNLTVTNPCQLTASSHKDKLTYPTTASNLFNEKGFVSSNWGGQYAIGQVFRVALLGDHFVSRIYVSLNTSVSKFRLRYSLDDEGQFWRPYEELEVWREFSMGDSYPSAEPAHLAKMEETGLRAGYFDLRVLQKMKWVEFFFTELENEDSGIKWRFELSGCQPDNVAPGNYIRACGLEMNSAKRPESYKRGFIADPDGKAVYVCEENLFKNNVMECFRMLIKNNKYLWTKMHGNVASIVGYLVKPEYQLFAVGQSQRTYLASSDVGDNWISVPTRDWWSARAQSSLKFKAAKRMPNVLPLKHLDDESYDWSKLQDSWYKADTFRANHTGIYHKVDSAAPWILVYNWGKICCSQ